MLATMVKHIVDRLLEQKDVYSLYLPGFQCINKHNIYILYLYIYDKRQISVYLFMYFYFVCKHQDLSSHILACRYIM